MGHSRGEKRSATPCITRSFSNISFAWLVKPCAFFLPLSPCSRYCWRNTFSASMALRPTTVKRLPGQQLATTNRDQPPPDNHPLCRPPLAILKKPQALRAKQELSLP